MTSLKAATKVNLGAGAASRVYAGSSWAWPITVPTSIPGLSVWLDASKLNLANGAAVTRWNNLGSSTVQLTILGSPPPTLRTNALNGLPVVRITGVQGKFRFTGTGVDKDYTLIYVGRKWTLKDGRVITANFESSGSPNVLWGYWGTIFDGAYVEGWLIPLEYSVTATLAWKLYSGDSTAAGTARLFSNGALLGSHPVPPPARGFNGTLNISGHYNNDNETADCEIAEVVLYNRKLSDAERQQVENYLRTKWNPIQPFKPTDLGSNLLGWFDGADASTIQLAGSGVNQWVNKGVGAMTFTQTDNAKRPTYANQTVSIVTPQSFVVTNSPATFDVILVSKPAAAAGTENNWRTLMRNDAQGGHQIILEDHTIRLGAYYAGFQSAGTNFPPPAMTSNTAPAPYVATSISEYPGGYETWKAFDANPATFWHSADACPAWIKIDLSVSKYVSSYVYQARPTTAGQAWKQWVLDGSNDNSTWFRVDTVNNEPAFSPSERRTYVCDTPGTYRYWRWYIYASVGTHAEAGALELFSSMTWDSVWGIGYGRISDTTTSLSRDGGVMMPTGAAWVSGHGSMHSFGGYSGGTQGWGDIKEVIFVAYNLGNNIRQMLEGYLAHKWGLTHLLPSDHPYRTVAP